MHNNLPDETQLANGQKFELLSLALLGVPSMAEKFLEVSSTLKQLSFDPADYVCMKFIILLNSGEKSFMFHHQIIIIILQRKCGTSTTELMSRSRASKSTRSSWSTAITAIPMFP